MHARIVTVDPREFRCASPTQTRRKNDTDHPNPAPVMSVAEKKTALRHRGRIVAARTAAAASEPASQRAKQPSERSSPLGEAAPRAKRPSGRNISTGEAALREAAASEAALREAVAAKPRTPLSATPPLSRTPSPPTTPIGLLRLPSIVPVASFGTCPCRSWSDCDDWRDECVVSQLEGGPLADRRHDEKCTWRAIPEVATVTRSSGAWLAEAYRIVDALVLPPLASGFYIQVPLAQSQEEVYGVWSRTWTPVRRDDFTRLADPWVHADLRDTLKHVAAQEYDVAEWHGASAYSYQRFRGVVEVSDADRRDADARILCDQHHWETWSARHCRTEDDENPDGGVGDDAKRSDSETRQRQRRPPRNSTESCAPSVARVCHPRPRIGAPPADEQRALYLLRGPGQNTQGDPAWVTVLLDLLDFRPDFPREWGHTLAWIRRRMERQTPLAEPCVLLVLAYLPMWIAHYHAAVPSDEHARLEAAPDRDAVWRFTALEYRPAANTSAFLSVGADDDGDACADDAYADDEHSGGGGGTIDQDSVASDAVDTATLDRGGGGESGDDDGDVDRSREGANGVDDGDAIPFDSIGSDQGGGGGGRALRVRKRPRK